MSTAPPLRSSTGTALRRWPSLNSAAIRGAPWVRSASWTRRIRSANGTLPTESALAIAVDGTLFMRSGKKVFGAAWHHDGGAKRPTPIGFGNCSVAAGTVVQLSFLSRLVCLPGCGGRGTLGRSLTLGTWQCQLVVPPRPPRWVPPILSVRYK